MMKKEVFICLGVDILDNEEIASCVYYALEDAKDEGKFVQKISIEVEKGLEINTIKVR